VKTLVLSHLVPAENPADLRRGMAARARARTSPGRIVVVGHDLLEL
jgi:hypothetical protein